MPDYETLQHDVLVIGSGGAGLRAAIEASAAAFPLGWFANACSAKRTR
jgi:succinate dehydrogenase / fumarate reductase flavoprotein subunit